MIYDLCGKQFNTIEALEFFIKNNRFETWWYKTKFVSTLQIRFLLYKYCSEHFPLWYDKNCTIWERESDFLCIFASNHFDLWWDKNKFDYDRGLFFLSKNCSAHFDKWVYPELKIVKKSTRIGVAQNKMNIHFNSYDKFINWISKFKSSKLRRHKTGVNNVT